MAKNQVFKYVDTLSLPVPAGTESGDPVVINPAIGLVGVAETNVGTRNDTGADSYNEDWNGGNGEGYATVGLQGAYRLDVTGALAVGDPVYVDGAGALTTAADDGAGVTYVRFGWSLDAKGTGTGPVTVVIDGAPAA